MATKKADQELLNELHNTLAQELLTRIRNGEATAADFNAARAFLRDNNISAIPTPNNGVGLLIQELPFDGSDDIDPDMLN